MKPKNLKSKVARRIHSRYKERAKRKGFKWSLTVEQVHEMIYQPCHYCGSKGKNQYKVAWGDGEEFSSISYRGIDRVYPKRGYTVSNTVPACWVCNNAKQQLTPAKFTAWIKRVARHLG